MTDTIYLYGILSEEDGDKYIDERKVLAQIQALTGEGDLHVRMKSPGGRVDIADAISALLRSTGRRLIGHIDGLAASAMTSIACTMDEVYMSEPGRYMIHNPGAGGYGTAKDKRKDADALDAMADMMAQVYAKRCGDKASVEQIKQWMDAETWFTASEALEYGFVDGIEASTMKVAALADDYAIALSRFNNTPKELIKEYSMKNIIAAMGLADSADETAVIAKFNGFKESLSEKTSLIIDLTAKVNEKEKTMEELEEEIKSLKAKLAKFKETETKAQLAKETGYIVGAEANEALTRRVEKYVAMSDGADKEDAYEDLKAFFVAKGVKAGQSLDDAGTRSGGDATTAFVAKAEALAIEKKITFQEAYNIVLKEAK